MVWPLPFSDVPDYHPVAGKQHARWFGGTRENGGRRHAACDLMAPLGTDVYAIADGTVINVFPTFAPYTTVGTIEVHHRTFVVRYCEVLPSSLTLRKGDLVTEGQVIAQVGKMTSLSMLHFELYSGTAAGPLSNPRNPPYFRRPDLLDPTSLLDELRGNLKPATAAMTIASGS